MARKKLFKSVDELIEGYELNTTRNGDRVKRKVYLRAAKLNGRVGLYQYSHINGVTNRKRLRQYLNVETSLDIKNQNEQIIRQVSANIDKMNDAILRDETNFPIIEKSSITLGEWIVKCADDAFRQTSNKRSYYYTLGSSLLKHIKACKIDHIKLQSIDANVIATFIEYLRNYASNINYLRNVDESKNRSVQLSQNSQHRLYCNLRYVINKAIKAKLLMKDPCLEIAKEDTPKSESGNRIFLSVEEIKKLINTDCKNEVVKRAFLFCCFVGLRFSDIASLRYGDIQRDENGLYCNIKMKKTKDYVRAYISDVAMRFIDFSGKNDDEAVIFKLPKNDHVNEIIHTWTKDAKIKKHISFHCSRHTAATMLLNLDVPIEIVAKQLGHKKLGTTQIYAKILGKTQAKAIDKQNDIFK